MNLRTLVLFLTLALGAQGASAATIWDESVDGDLSSNRLAPTVLTLAVGSNTISGTVIAGERDYFRFNVGAGQQVTQIILSGYAPANLGFLAVQTGTTITVDPLAPVAGPLLGYVHTAGAQVGTDILDDMALGAGSIGFVPPLGANDYSFWMQQTSAILTSYSFDVVLVPEPATASLLALGLGLLTVAGRRRS